MSQPSGLYQTKVQVMEKVFLLVTTMSWPRKGLEKDEMYTDSLAAAYDVLRRTPPVLASTEYDVLRHVCLVLNAVIGRTSGWKG
jgi:hypothetical protein